MTAGFNVQVAVATGLQIDSIADALLVLGGTNQASTTTVTAATINYGAGGNFGSDTAFPGSPTPTEDFAVRATGTITIPSGAGGDWTFGIHHDDGFRLRIDGLQVAIHDGASGGTSFPQVHLAEGTHTIELIYFERSGGEIIELFAQAGLHASFNSGFQLIGDTGAGGLAVTTDFTDPNDAPVNTLPASFSTPEDTAVQLTGLSVADADAGAGTITVTLSVAAGEGTLSATSGGGVTVTGSGSNSITLSGTLSDINTFLGGTSAPSYTPAADASGDVTLTMTTDDGGNTGDGGALSDSDAVTITVLPVNDAPTATDDSLSSVAEDSGVRIISFASLTGNDSKGPANESGQSLTITAISNVVGGTAVINGTNIEFTPDADFNGTASFDYTVRDDGQTSGSDDFKTDTGSVSFAVTAVNDAPVNALPATFSTSEDTAVQLTGLSVADVDAASGTISVTLSVTAGTLSATGEPTVSVTGSGTASLTLEGTLTSLNTYLGSGAAPFFSPAANTSGSVTLTMTTSDGGNSGSGGILSDADSSTITVTAVNDAPVNTLPANYTTDEDTELTLTGLSIEDVDAGSGEITVTLSVTSGTLNAVGDLVVMVAGDGTNELTLTGTRYGINTFLAGATAPTFIPAGNAHGDVTLTMTTSDGGNTGEGGAQTDTDTATITVTAVNDAPAAATSGNAASGGEDSTITGNLPAGSDVDGDTPLTYHLVAPVAGLTLATDGSFAYSPTEDFNGDVTFSYVVRDPSDADSAPRSFTITVEAINDDPVAEDDTLSSILEDSPTRIISFASLLGNDSKGPANESGQALTITAVSNVVGGTAVINGTNIEFTVTTDYYGPASFDYSVRDDGQSNGTDDFLTDTGTVTFDILPVNDAPTDGDDVFVSGGGNETINGGRGNDWLDLTLSRITSDTIVNLATGTVTGAGTGTDRLVSIEHVTGGAGDDSITGSRGGNILDGASGDDLLLGGSGADALVGSSGSDTIYGGTGNDAAEGGLDDDLILGESGNDDLDGDDGDDTVDGGSGHDTLEGGSGADSLLGGSGNDVLRGDDGDDAIDTLEGGAGNDVVYADAWDIVSGGSGRDTLVVSGTDSYANLAATGFEVALVDLGNATLDGSGSRVALGLYGGDGDDELIGGLGRDTIRGGDGADSIDGGRGNDSLSGGDDADTFFFDANWGRDTITDFEDGVDKIAIGGVTSIAQLTITTRGTVTTISVVGDRANTITVLDATAGTIGADDFDLGGPPV